MFDTLCNISNDCNTDSKSSQSINDIDNDTVLCGISDNCNSDSIKSDTNTPFEALCGIDAAGKCVITLGVYNALCDTLEQRASEPPTLSQCVSQRTHL